MSGSTWKDFTNTAAPIIDADEVNANFDWLEGHIVPQLAGTKTDSTYDLGETAYRFRQAYIDDITVTTGITAGGNIEGGQITSIKIVGVLNLSISVQTLDSNGYATFASGKALYQIESNSGTTDDMVKLNGAVYQNITIVAKIGHTITIKDDAAHALVGGFTCGSDRVLTGNNYDTATFIFINDSWCLTGYQAN